MEWENNFQQKIQQFTSQSNAQNRMLMNFTLPVVVHIIYWNTTDVNNISQAQVNSQITVLNNDFAGTGTNVSSCPTVFQPLIANCGINFCLAKVSPTNATLVEPGIDRVNAQTKGFTNPGTTGYDFDYINNTIKPATIWDPTKYLNIWVVSKIANPLGEVLGYATFPAMSNLSGIPDDAVGTATTDGLVIGYKYFGTIGAVEPTYNLGRTSTHEIGHWLGLRHISGDAQCGSDFCDDTPTQLGGNGGGFNGLNYGCPTFPFQANQCSANGQPNGELFMDFMDYTDDECMYLFTPDQRTRMQTAMTNGTYRFPLISSTVCNLPAAAPIADFSSNKQQVCIGSAVQFKDLSSNFPSTWSWTFTGGSPATSNSKTPLVTYNSAGVYPVSLTVTNGSGSNSITKTGFITVGTIPGVTLPFTENFESTTSFPPTGWIDVDGSTMVWDLSSSAGGFGTSSKSMFFENFPDFFPQAYNGAVATKVLDLNGAGNTRLKFDVAYAQGSFFGSPLNDTLEVIIQDVCTDATTTIYKKGGASLKTAPLSTAFFTPTATQWRKDSINIPAAFLNKKIVVIFNNIGEGGNNIYVDNINVYSTTTATPTATAAFTSSDSAVCVANSLTFTSTSTASTGSLDSIRWTCTGATPGTATTTTYTPVFNTVGTYTVTLKAYKSGNVSTATKTITVKALPTVAAITGNTNVCLNSTRTLSNTTPNGTWNSSNTTVATVSSSGVVTGLSLGTSTISYTVNSNGCFKSVNTVVTVSALPNANAGADKVLTCSASSVTLSGSSTTSGVTYTWSGPSILSGGNTATPSVNAVGTYTLTVTNSTTGCSNTDQVAVTSNGVLPNSNAGADKVLTCSVTSVTLNGSSTTSGVTYSWSGPGIVSGGNTASPSVNAAGVYTLTVTITATGCTNTDQVTVSADITKPTANAGVDKVITCTNPTQTIGSTTVNGNTYTWSPSSGLSSSTIAQPTTSATNTYIVTVTKTSNGCVAKDTVIVTVDTVRPNVTVNNATICSGQSATLIASGADTYSWTSLGTGNPRTTPALTTNASYTVTGTKTSNGCTKTAVASVTVKPLPSTPIITQRNDTLETNVVGSSYIWYKNGAIYDTTTIPVIKITESGIYTVKIVGTNQCVSPLSSNFNATITGLKNNKLDVKYVIMPNPNNGNFSLNITSKINKSYILKVYNINGETILTDELNLRVGLNSKKINLDNLEKGVYLLSIIGDEGISTQSIVIQ